ncbi:hypothetical protein [Rhizobium sp. Rhizsp82]|jgi:hypothetical protein|uniref:hypothetical protein n=1 Tax=Rhizobium sp. Rhizsp82 TaxID=3243057 RepID=UPI0039B508EF
MLVIISAAVITLVATLAARYLLAKTRLTEKSIDAAIARRLHTSPVLSEMRELRELNGVMRNILADLVENEELAVRRPDDHRSPATRTRLVAMREARRREIYGEAILLLRQTARTRTAESPVRAAH